MVHSTLGEAGFSGETLFAILILPMFKQLRKHTLELPLFKLFTWMIKYYVIVVRVNGVLQFNFCIITIDEWLRYSRQSI